MKRLFLTIATALVVMTVFVLPFGKAQDRSSLLSLDQVTVLPSVISVTVPLTFTLAAGTESPSDANMTISHSAKLTLDKAILGEAGQLAGKTLYTQYYPEDREIVLVITALNRTSFPSGELAQLQFKILDSSPGEALLHFVTANMNTDSASVVPISTQDGAVTFREDTEEAEETEGAKGTEDSEEADESEVTSVKCGGCQMGGNVLMTIKSFFMIVFVLGLVFHLALLLLLPRH